MAHTHVWLDGCTGMGKKLLRTGKPFDAAEHPYIDIDEAVEKGRAKPLKPAAEAKADRPYTPPPVSNFNELPKKGKKGKK